MILIRGRAVTFGELWFEEEAASHAGVDILICRQRPQAIEDRTCSPFLTVVNDLTLGEDSILAGFGRTTRYEVNRAQTKDGIEARIVAPTSECLGTFCDFYDVFARQKSLEPVYRRGLWAAAEAGQLMLTQAAREGEALVWHAYILWRDCAALLYSASHLRLADKSARALTSRANRWLHWHDMRRLKTEGLKRYDWGGLFQDEDSPERAGINAFKCDFGGRREMTYNCTFPVTAKGRLYLTFRGALDRLVH